MKNELRSIIVAILLCHTSFAQNTEDGILWEISGKGLSKPSYLFGKIDAHYQASLPAEAIDAIGLCSRIYAETDIDDPDRDQIFANALIREDKFMGDVLKEKQYFQLDNMFYDRYGYSIALMGYLSPALLRYSLKPETSERWKMFSMDSQLIAVARKQNKEILGLESIGMLRNFYDKVPYELQVNELVRIADRGMEYDNGEFLEIVALYKLQDVNGIHMMYTESVNSLHAYVTKILLKERNVNWINIMKVAMASGPTFFAVPAENLGSYEGLIKLLRSSGYKVESVSIF